MEALNTNSLYSKIEFDKILNKISRYSLSEEGSKSILSTNHSKNFEDVEKSHTLLRELLNFYRFSQNKLSTHPFINFSTEIYKITKGDILSAVLLYQISIAIRLYFNIKNVVDNDANFINFKSNFSVKQLSNDFYIEILKYINADGYIDSKITPELFKIRGDLSRMEEKINSCSLESLSKLKKQNLTTLDSVTIRDGLPCIAVKSNHKSSLDGLILDYSASGRTVFIVPKRVIELKNEMKLLYELEKEEIFRILTNYTNKILSNYEDILVIDRELLFFDILNSKAKYSIDNLSVSPTITNDNQLRLINGKNPFLSGNVIPLNIEIGKDYNTIIITGPNTGGKTVVLKTIGLFCLMIQSGIGIPADINSSFPVFDNIFADIGDEQSIENSLSTFSGHIKNIISILNSITQKSLVLIDELGTGTDPTEGEALAISIIKFLKTKNTTSLITSHFNGLKYFATQEDGVANGAMEFDSKNNIPTFRLNIGIPGNSKALEISKNLGMKEEIIIEAKKIISKGFFEIDKIIESLRNDRKSLDTLIDENKLLNNELQKKEDELKIKLRELKDKEKDLNNIIRDKNYDFLVQSRKDFENIIKEIRTNAASKESIKHGKDFLSELQIKTSLKEDESSENDKNNNTQLNIGDYIKIISKDVNGYIIDKTNKQDEYLVQAGIIKIKVISSDIKKLENNNKNDYSVRSANVVIDSTSKSFSLDIRGNRCEQAEKKLDGFIENSLLNGYSEVRIIHGLGTGALRNFVMEYLKNHSFVIDYGYEEDSNIGKNYGVTIVRLK